VILRPGAIDATGLSRVLRRPVVTLERPAKTRAVLRAPGLLDRHYSPRTPLRLTARPVQAHGTRAVILLRKPAGPAVSGTYWLSQRGSLAEIAHNLYRVLREADAAGHREILIEAVPPTAGRLAAAINDRIRRAAA
jgi:L-threonylcarbamoyladenylate synthase